ncbi:APC family permease [Priestia megaterium]
METKRNQAVPTLKLSHIVLFGLAYMTPMIVFGIYGLLAETTHGLVSTAYIVALAAMLFTAYSYGKMTKAFPIAGSAYTYTRKSINPYVGFMIGWAVLLDYLFLPMVIWLIGAVYLHTAFPSIPLWTFVLAFIFITTVINIIGLKAAANVNTLMMIFQLLVVGIFISLSIIYLIKGSSPFALFSFNPFLNEHLTFSFVAAGASIACYSFLGFDAVTTLSEETLNPEKTMPKAIFLITLIGGIIFIGASYFLQLVHPDYTSFKNIDSAAFEIAVQIGGNLFSSIFLAGLIIAQFASGLSAQTSGARLLFAMGRDGVLPAKIFGYLHRKSKTPLMNILFIGGISLLAVKLDVSTSTSFINFGAFLTFIFVNLSVIFHYYFTLKNERKNRFLLYFLIPAIGAALDFYLFINLDKHALVLGSVWTSLGLVYLTFLTKGFKLSPPEMDFDEEEVMKSSSLAHQKAAEKTL